VGSAGQSGVSDWVYDPGSIMVQNANGHYSSITANHTLGIGYSYPEYGWTWPSTDGNPRAIREASIVCGWARAGTRGDSKPY
jgi:hypothetical protein